MIVAFEEAESSFFYSLSPSGQPYNGRVSIPRACALVAPSAVQ